MTSRFSPFPTSIGTQTCPYQLNFLQASCFEFLTPESKIFPNIYFVHHCSNLVGGRERAGLHTITGTLYPDQQLSKHPTSTNRHQLPPTLLFCSAVTANAQP